MEPSSHHHTHLKFIAFFSESALKNLLFALLLYVSSAVVYNEMALYKSPLYCIEFQVPVVKSSECASLHPAVRVKVDIEYEQSLERYSCPGLYTPQGAENN